MLTATATGAINCVGCTLEVIIQVIVGAISRANNLWDVGLLQVVV